MSHYKTHYKALIKLGFPLVLGQLSMVLLSFFDTLMVGHYGIKELAASSFVISIMQLPLLAIIGLTLGLVPLVGAFYGKGEKKKAGETLRNSIVVNTLATIMICIIMIFCFFFIDKMGQPIELLPFIKPYYILQLTSIPFVTFFYTAKQFTDSLTLTRISMQITFSGVIFNIILNYFLIYGIGPFPELGLTGAGIATLLARISMAIWYWYYITKRPQLKQYQEGFFQGQFSYKQCKKLLNIGFPIALQMLLEGSAFNITTIFAGWIGVHSLAAHQILLTISTLFFMQYLGLGSAIAIRISHFNGQKDYISVKKSAIAGTHLITLIVMFNIGLIFFLRNFIGSLFTNEIEVISLISGVMIPMMIYQIGDGLQITYCNALRGIGDVKPIAIISLICYIFLSVPLSYIFGIYLNKGLFGIWIAFPISLSLAGIFFTIRFFSRIKQS